MTPLAEKLRAALQQFRHRLAFHDALPQLVVLGLLSGALAAILIVLFRWLVESPLAWIFQGESDGFENLPPLMRFLFPFVGACVLGAYLQRLAPEHRAVSVSHVLERLHNHQGRLPAGNMVVQFIGGIIALVSGQSVGREGPAIHLGAGAASLLGQHFRLPNNSLRTLVGCGAAAGIAASFNTPMAGVIFAMEVILMEYTLAGFVPIIIASVLGATLSQLVFGDDLNFIMSAARDDVLGQLPFLVLVGLVFSVAAACFIRLHLAFFALYRYSLALRFAFIGLVTGAVAVFLPQIMGTGYDTLHGAMLGQVGLITLLFIVLAKLVVTAMATGLGMVGGLIGPTLVIGGCLGAVLGALAGVLYSSGPGPDFYVVLGMVAMMGAVLNAPLAALVAILELSQSSGIIFPSMLTVVVACVGVRVFFNYRGVFTEQLRFQGHDLFAEPGRGFLSRVGVASVMNRSLHTCQRVISHGEARALVERHPLWLVFPGPEDRQLLATAELARYLQNLDPDVEDSAELDLGGDKLHSTAYAEIDVLVSLAEASAIIKSSGADALLVIESDSRARNPVVGVVTRETITAYYGL